MVRIRCTGHMILAQGHAENREICGLFSGACASARAGFELAGEPDTVAEISKGQLYVNLDSLETDAGRFVAEVLKRSCRMLASEYPASFSYSETHVE